jgi:hypothetical protein
MFANFVTFNLKETLHTQTTGSYVSCITNTVFIVKQKYRYKFVYILLYNCDSFTGSQQLSTAHSGMKGCMMNDETKSIGKETVSVHDIKTQGKWK